MKINEVENKIDNTIVQIIKTAQKIFGTDNLSSGNCGNFALALGKILKEKGINVKLAFIFREVDNTSYDISKDGIFAVTNDDVDTDSIAGVVKAETDIYHVFLDLGNNIFYDGTGKITVDDLLDMAEYQYDDENPGYFNDIDLNDPDMLRLIRTETNCRIPMQTFYQKIKEKI